MKFINKINLSKQIYGCLDAVIPLVLAQLSEQTDGLVFIARDDVRLARIEAGLLALSDQIEVVSLPAWDCLPYDRVSAHSTITAKRVQTLSRLAVLNSETGGKPVVLLTTVNGWLQKLPRLSYFADTSLHLQAGQTITQETISAFLSRNGFRRTQTVREYGEYSVRGGILDIYPHTDQLPVRLDFFGDEIESIKFFDSLSQRSEAAISQVDIRPAHEYLLDEDTITRFRQGYLKQFGGRAARDHIYEAVSAGQTTAGLEHWLALLHDGLLSVHDQLPEWRYLFDVDAEAVWQARLDQIADFYQARMEAVGTEQDQVYRPLPPEQMYLTSAEVTSFHAEGQTTILSGFSRPETAASDSDTGARLGPTFGAEAASEASPSVAAAQHIRQAVQTRPVILTAASTGSLTRMTELIGGHLEAAITQVDRLDQVGSSGCYALLSPVEAGFESPFACLITEQDVFGVRSSRPQGRRRADDFLREVSSLEAGDLVVHVEHGIGRYEGLETIRSDGTDHDCLHLSYAGGDRLYLPVENIELLSRYGQEGSEASLDKLGGAGWQARKAKIKGRIREMADQLMKIAAKREVATAEPLSPPDGVFAEFCARFGHPETDDQLDAISDVLTDLSSGRATDRLICGDVGFGKTEVALRAAFVAAMAGYQVALVTPTTLLARQHGRLFEERFKGFPVNVATLSRMAKPKEAANIKAGLKDGSVQMVVGTHALLAKSIEFNNLGLLIIDEEQNFGVAQKERLKELRGDIHVLTLSATPIPRTLQLALSGVRNMSIIATPPVDRLAVRTFVGGWDGVVLKEAILRERFRGGHTFMVCPRISDLSRIYDRLITLVPDLKILTAHGKMSATELDQAMTDFGDGAADVLLSTNIIESGIDIPTANTLIIHRSDMFGLAQLYQLRGRVGRSKERAYAYLTTDPQMILTPQARRRLEVMQTLDKLGAGFSLASYDMDIRGAGNLLGDEQSGHVKEVGIELYQDMLKQAVEAARLDRAETAEEEAETGWSPQITLGTSVLIPDAYVPDLSVRLSLYRRIGALAESDDVSLISAELVDRFGPVPQSVKNLLEIVVLKQFCKRCNIQKLDAGDKGFALSFKDNHFARPDQLIGWIAKQGGAVQLRADHKLIIKTDLKTKEARADQARGYLQDIAGLLDNAA